MQYEVSSRSLLGFLPRVVVVVVVVVRKWLCCSHGKKTVAMVRPQASSVAWWVVGRRHKAEVTSCSLPPTVIHDLRLTSLSPSIDRSINSYLCGFSSKGHDGAEDMIGIDPLSLPPRRRAQVGCSAMAV
ncbi:hypothetical protein BHM03_00056965 [Ensete ventricosum]|nr:hypothetical protein BHM03_00056965 [Ensete ventricosum]